MYHAVLALIGAYKIRKVFAVHHIMSSQHSAGLIGKKSGIIHISKSRYYFDKDNLGLAGTHQVIKFLPLISHIIKSFKCLPYLSGYTIGGSICPKQACNIADTLCGINLIVILRISIASVCIPFKQTIPLSAFVTSITIFKPSISFCGSFSILSIIMGKGSHSATFTAITLPLSSQALQDSGCLQLSKDFRSFILI